MNRQSKNELNYKLYVKTRKLQTNIKVTYPYTIFKLITKKVKYNFITHSFIFDKLIIT